MKHLNQKIAAAFLNAFSKLYYAYAIFMAMVLILASVALIAVYHTRSAPDSLFYRQLIKMLAEQNNNFGDVFNWQGNASQLLSLFCDMVSSVFEALVWGCLAWLVRGAGTLNQKQILDRIRLLPFWLLGIYVFDLIVFATSKLALKMHADLYSLLSALHNGWIVKFFLPSFHGATSLIFALLAFAFIRLLKENISVELKLHQLEEENQLIV